MTELTMSEENGIIKFHGETDYKFGSYVMEEWCEHLVQGMQIGLATKEVGCKELLAAICCKINAVPQENSVETFLKLLPKEYREDLEWAEQPENYGLFSMSNLMKIAEEL